MYSSTALLVSLLGLLSGISALTFTSPSPGTAIDPTQPITISWTSDASDPTTINLIVSDANDSSLFPAQTVVQGISSSSGSYTVPANTIKAYGTGFQISASGDGKTVGTLNSIILGAGSNQVSTASNGQITFVSMATAGSAASTQAATTGATTTVAPSSNAPAAASSVTVLTGTVTSSQSTTNASFSRSSSKTAGFVTSSTSRSSSGASAAATTSAADSNTANAQFRVGSELVLGAAGVLAGFVALLA